MRFVAAVIFLSGIAAPAVAGEAISVQDYVKKAIEASPDLDQSRQILEQAKALWKSQLGAAILPTLSFSAVDYPYGNNPVNGYAFNAWRMNWHDFSFNTTANLNVFNSFQDYLKVKSASASKESAFQSIQSANQRTALAALASYYDLSLRQHLIEVAQQNLKAQQAQYDLSQDLYHHGMKSLTDLLKSETDLRSSELRLASAEADEKGARIQFNVLINRPGLDPVILTTELQPGTTYPPDIPSSIERAKMNRPEVLKARSDFNRSTIGFQQSLQANLPALAVNATWNRQDLASFGLPSSQFGIPNPNYQVGLSLSLPLGFNLYSQFENATAALAEKKRALGALESVVRQVQVDVYSAVVALDRAATTYRIALQKESNASRNLELVTEQYRQGAADVILLAQAQLDYLQARTESAQALHDIAVGRAQYQLAVGEPIW